MIEKNIEYFISKEDKINFLAVAITPLHIIGIKAMIKYLKSQGVMPKGYVFLLPHDITGRLLHSDDCDFFEDSIKVVETYQSNKKEIKNYRLTALKKSCETKAQNTIYIVWTSPDYSWFYYLSQFDCKIVYVLIDDGAGSYTNHNKNILRQQLFENKNRYIKSLKAIFRYPLIEMYDFMFNRFLMKNNSIINGRFFNVKNGTIDGINSEICKYYVSIFKNSKIDYSKYNKILGGAILINTQCLIENQIINDSIDYCILSELYKIAQRNLIKVVIKPHPREKNIDRYYSICDELLLSNHTQEEIISNISSMPLCVISFYSSTLLNLAGLFSIPAISLASIMRNTKISSALNSLLKEYETLYKHIFWFPQNMVEVDRIIKKLKEKNINE